MGSPGGSRGPQATCSHWNFPPARWDTSNHLPRGTAQTGFQTPQMGGLWTCPSDGRTQVPFMPPRPSPSTCLCL